MTKDGHLVLVNCLKGWLRNNVALKPVLAQYDIYCVEGLNNNCNDFSLHKNMPNEGVTWTLQSSCCEIIL